jgi:predicted house-cleaning NTP pyrophosphatase (Maf/HAM1 superfamily)
MSTDPGLVGVGVGAEISGGGSNVNVAVAKTDVGEEVARDCMTFCSWHAVRKASNTIKTYLDGIIVIVIDEVVSLLGEIYGAEII